MKPIQDSIFDFMGNESTNTRNLPFSQTIKIPEDPYEEEMLTVRKKEINNVNRQQLSPMYQTYSRQSW